MDDILKIGWQERLLRGVVDSNVQPTQNKPGSGRQDYIGYYFTAPSALAYLRLRKEGEHYVRD